MLQTAIPVLASLNEEETIKFYTEKLGFTFHASWDGYLIMSRDGFLFICGPVLILLLRKVPAAI
jgi:catechol 2,3-dioxygenase-like lactoylglutathione lyase family enzyme